MAVKRKREDTLSHARAGINRSTAVATTPSSAAKKLKTERKKRHHANGASNTSNAPTSSLPSIIPVAPAAPFRIRTGEPVTIEVLAGSYDRVLHGIVATLSPSARQDPKQRPPADENPTSKKGERDKEAPEAPHEQEEEGAYQEAAGPRVEFADSFLFNAHLSAIRCLALSPPSSSTFSIPSSSSNHQAQEPNVLLATGSGDDRINIYQLTAVAPSRRARAAAARARDQLAGLIPSLPSPARQHGRVALEDPRNRQLATLLHHSSGVTRLSFPYRAKLLSASEDSTLAVTRTRDWVPLQSLKCPVPKGDAHGRVATTSTGDALGGVNDFAVHPSGKILISVGRGERCMRLWNLETGRKSRVLNFDRAALAQVGEGGRYSTGEARRIVWSPDGDGFAVAFDRDVVAFGMDSLPRCRLMPDARVKLHGICYVAAPSEQAKDGEDGEGDVFLLAVSTEDGRVLFFSAQEEDLARTTPEEGEGGRVQARPLPPARLVAQLGGKEDSVKGRIKDFKVLPVEDEDTGIRSWYVAAGSSDGKLRVWRLEAGDLAVSQQGSKGASTGPVRRGELLGTYETHNRITCLEAFIMIPRTGEDEEDEDEDEDDSDEDDGEDDEFEGLDEKEQDGEDEN